MQKTKHTRCISAIVLHVYGLFFLFFLYKDLVEHKGDMLVTTTTHTRIRTHTHTVQKQVSYGNSSLRQTAGGHEKKWETRRFFFTRGLTVDKCAVEGMADKSFRKAQSFRKRIHLELNSKEVPRMRAFTPAHTQQEREHLIVVTMLARMLEGTVKQTNKNKKQTNFF